ncbi:MAG: sensor histidine kinase [Defluviitaleaceae bacterium]|nr:sensor histidine kinase [Defluviitaleaceae bacterium]
MKNGPIRLPIIIFYVLAVFAVFAAVIFLTDSEAEYINNAEALSRFDFSVGLTLISPDAFDRHPEALYTPNDFLEGRASAPTDASTSGRYATYRLVLNLQEGVLYGITGPSATHSMTLWVDGVMLAQVGAPGNSYENMTAQTNFFTVYFVAGYEPTEIIIQRSGFVLAHGGRLNPLYFGEQPLITSWNILGHIRISILIGVTLMSVLLYLGIYLFFRNQKRFLWFSLVCVMIALRTLGIDFRIIATLLPQMTWQLDYLLAYLVTSVFAVAMILYIDAMFNNGANRLFKYVAIGFFAVHGVFMVFTSPAVYSQFNTPYNILMVLFISGILANNIWQTVRNRAKWQTEYVLVIMGSVVNIVLGVTEVAIRAATPEVVANYTQAGTLVFIFINTIALTIYFRRNEMELDETKKHEQQLANENATLESLNRLKNNYLANMAHETKTPLTLISVDIQLAEALYEGDGEDAKLISEALGRAREEILRVTRITENNLKLAKMQSSYEKMTALDFSEILKSGAEVRRRLTEKNGNALVVSVPDDLPKVYGNADQLIQVLSNLIDNSNRHTKYGKITITAGVHDGFVVAKVLDNGTGIPYELLPKIFVRGVSNSDSTGIGLPISKQIVESHGGTISVQSEEGKGCAVIINLPIYPEEGETENV